MTDNNIERFGIEVGDFVMVGFTNRTGLVLSIDAENLTAKLAGLRDSFSLGSLRVVPQPPDETKLAWAAEVARGETSLSYYEWGAAQVAELGGWEEEQ